MTRTISQIIDLYPGTRAALAGAMGCTRKALWSVEHHEHKRSPMRLLAAMQRAFIEKPPIDGSPVPLLADLVNAFLKGKRKAKAVTP